MGKLQVNVISAQLFHRAPLITEDKPSGTTPVTHVEICVDHLGKSQSSNSFSGYMPQYNSVLVFEGVNWWNHIAVAVKYNEDVVGHCLISLLRLVTGKERKHWFTIATPGQNANTVVAGYVQIGLMSEDITQLEGGEPISDDTAALIMQMSHYDLLMPKLTRILAAHNPTMLHIVDLILSEGLSGHAGTEYIPQRLDQLLSPEQSVEQYFSAAANIIAGPESAVVKSVAIEVKSGESLGPVDVDSVSPKVIITSLTQEMITHPAICTKDPKYVGEERLFDAFNEETVLHITVVDHNPNGSESLLSQGSFNLRSVARGLASTRDIPLLTTEGKYGGTITLNLYSEDLGKELSAEENMILRDFYPRLTRFFIRYDQPRLSKVDNIAAQNYNSVEAKMDELVDEYGLEPGTSTVSLRVKSVESLMSHHVPVGRAELVVEVSMPMNDKATRIVKYSNNKATFNDELTLDVVRQTDVISITVIDDNDRKKVFGTAHISLSSLQIRVVKRRKYLIVSDAGTINALVAGTVEIELYSEQMGHMQEMDEYYEKVYSKKLRHMFTQYYPEKLHRIDVVLSTTYDMERYLVELFSYTYKNKDKNKQRASVLRIMAKSAKGLNEECENGAAVVSYVGIDAECGAKGVTRDPEYPPVLMSHLIEYPDEDVVIISITSSVDQKDQGHVYIPVKNLWRNAKKDKSYELMKDGKSCGEVLLNIETIECGTTDGSGDPVPFIETVVPIEKVVPIENVFRDEDVRKSTAEKVGTILKEEEEEISAARRERRRRLRKEIDDYEDGRIDVILDERIRERDRTVYKELDKNGIPIVREINTVATDLDMPSKLHRTGHHFHVNVDSVTSLSRDGKFEPVVCAYVKLRVRNQNHRTQTEHGEARELVFKHHVEFSIDQPEVTDALYCSVYREDTEGDYRYGCCEIDITRVVKGVIREVYVPIVTNAETGEATVTGFIAVRILCKSWGRPPETCVDLTSAQQTRIRNFYVKYNPQLLHRLDFENDGAEGFDIIMAKNVERFGPEPDTRTLRITVIGCDGLESSGGHEGYYVSLKVGKQIQETKTVFDVAPRFGDTFAYIVNPKSKEHITLVLYYDGVEYGRCLMSLRNLPPNSVKRRTVAIVSNATKEDATNSGRCTLEFYAVDFGCNSIPSDEAERILRNRVHALLMRYAPQELHKAELMLGDHVRHEEDLMTLLISRYGCVPGDARLAVTVKEVRNLFKNGKPIQNGNIYVKIKTSMEKSHTRTISKTKHAFFDETFTFDLARPEKDVLQFSVFNDEFGGDYLYGEALVSLGNVQKGTSRQITAMIVHNAETPEATPAGYITIVLRSDDFGSAAPIDSSSELMWRNRLKNFFTKYCPEKLHAIEVVCSSQWDMPGYMSKMVKQYGPEPLTYELQVTVVEVRDLPDMNSDASVVITQGVDTLVTRNVRPQGNTIHFNEMFQLAVTNPDQDEISFSVQKGFERMEQGRVVLSLKNCIMGVEKTINTYLVANTGTKNAQIIGEISIKLFTTRFGLSPSSVLPEEEEKQIRRTLESIFANHNPSELHRIEVTIGTLPPGRETQTARNVVQHYVKNAESIQKPVTIRIRSLQTTVKGQYILSCSSGSKSLLRTKPIRVETDALSVNLVKEVHDNTVVTFMTNPATATLEFTLSGQRSTIGSSSIKLAKLHRDSFNTRLLTFFNNSNAIATALVDIRSVGFSNDAKPLNNIKWARVQRDVISVLSRYDPTALPRIDAIVQETDDIDGLHSALLAKYHKDAMLTVYIESIFCELFTRVGKNIQKLNQLLTLKARVGDISDSTTLHLINKNKEGGCAEPSSSLLSNDVSLLSSDNNYIIGIIPSAANKEPLASTTGYLYQPSNSLIRLDLTRKCIEAPLMKLEVKCGNIFIGEVGISLLPLFASIVAPGEPFSVPLIGVTPGQNGPRCVGSVSLSFGYPYLQDVPRSVVQRRPSSIVPSTDSPNNSPTRNDSPRRILRNASFINYYFNRTMNYLKEFDPQTATNFHDSYYGLVLLGSDWETGAPVILAEHVKRVGAPENATEPPPLVVP